MKSTQEASLDVIGHMLAEGALPDAKLVDQILAVSRQRPRETVPVLVQDTAQEVVRLAKGLGVSATRAVSNSQNDVASRIGTAMTNPLRSPAP